MENDFVPLFAFASNLEFFGVFPECKSFVQSNIRLGEIVELPEGRGFAVVLGVGMLADERHIGSEKDTLHMHHIKFLITQKHVYA